MDKYPYIKEITLEKIVRQLKSEFHVWKKDLNTVFGYQKRLERILKKEGNLEKYECEKLFTFIRSRAMSHATSLPDTLRNWFPAISSYSNDLEVEEIVEANLLGRIDEKAGLSEANDKCLKGSTFLLQCKKNISPIKTVKMAFHTGWLWLKDLEKTNILVDLMNHGVFIQVIANPDEVIRDMATSFRNPALELRYTSFNETLAEWHKYERKFKNLSLRISSFPILRLMILVEFQDGTARGFFRDYAYGYIAEKMPAVVRNEKEHSELSIYTNEFSYLWERSRSYDDWHSSLPKREEVMETGKYVLLYPAHGNDEKSTGNMEDGWVYSLLVIEPDNQVNLFVNIPLSMDAEEMDRRKQEYSYRGEVRLTGKNVFFTLTDDSDKESVNLTFWRPLHNRGRFLGILSALSPSGLPVSLKCAMINPELLPKIDKAVLRDILCRQNNTSGNLMILDLQDYELFDSKKILY